LNLKNTVSLSIAILVGFVLLGRSMERFRKEDRFVTVKGFSEREVKSDLAVWSIYIRIPGNDLSEGSKATELAKEQIFGFLKKNGIAADEILQKEIQVSDRQANEYGPENASSKYRYVISKLIQVRSSNVDTVLKVSQMADELVKSGVTMAPNNDWQNNGVRFMFKGLNKIKPEMLAEATRNARTAAVEFTKESGTELGKMRKASQGLFTVVDRDVPSSAQGESGYFLTGITDLYKRVRVVVSVDYSIE